MFAANESDSHHSTSCSRTSCLGRLLAAPLGSKLHLVCPSMSSNIISCSMDVYFSHLFFSFTNNLMIYLCCIMSGNSVLTNLVWKQLTAMMIRIVYIFPISDIFLIKKLLLLACSLHCFVIHPSL